MDPGPRIVSVTTCTVTRARTASHNNQSEGYERIARLHLSQLAYLATSSETANWISRRPLSLKCLVLAHGRDAELTPEKFSSDQGRALLDEIEQHWQTAEAAFQQLRDFIEHELRLFSPSVVRSYTSFIPLFDYFYHHPQPDHESRTRMKAYYYKSQLFNWFARRYGQHPKHPPPHSHEGHG